MELTPEQFDKIKICFLKEKEKPYLRNKQIVNAILYIAVHQCNWSHLPLHFGDWKSIYNRMNKWVKNGVLETVFAILQYENIIRVKGHPTLLKYDLQHCKKKPIPLSSKLHQQPETTFDPNNQPRLIWLPDLLEKQIQLRKTNKV